MTGDITEEGWEHLPATQPHALTKLNKQLPVQLSD